MSFNDWLHESAERFQNYPPHTATRRSARAFFNGACRRLGSHIGTPIWQHGDWDVLVVLDAARSDLMREVLDEYPELPDGDAMETRWSNASCSIDWQLRNFTHYRDDQPRTAGYVTANPFADHAWPDAKNARLSQEPLALFEPLYRTHWTDVKPGIATVPPEAVTDYTIQAWRDRHQHGLTHLVAHYMQPHEPYRSRPEWGSGDHKLLENLVDPSAEPGRSVWPQLQDGEIDHEEFWEVYKDNLRWVLDDVVERLLPNVEGRVVLTADHGNAMGEWGEWHHPPSAIGPSVRRVPWVPVNATDRETVHPDVRETDRGDVEVEDQLAALGYMEG